MPDVLRIIDANLNRAREAARVMEEAARFALDDRGLAADLKSLRHEIAAAAQSLPESSAARDVVGDVGVEVTTETERVREDLGAVAVAAGKRLGEALRCLEEYGKLVHPDFGAGMKAMRYRAYEVERRLLLRLHGRGRQWTVCVLLTASICRHPWETVAEAAFEGGADCVQLREKSLSDRDLLRRARWLVETAPDGAQVIVNDRPDIALLAGADGVHLGQGDLPVAAVRRLAGGRLLIGASTHDRAEADAAVAAGADYCGVGAMFATALKPERAPAGVPLLREFLERHPRMPHLAIGGIGPDNVREVAAAGGKGVAVSAAVCGADDPAAVVRALRAVLVPA
ncbi:MAG: thiamine phosphate synthase [Phycisphaerales bacterium]|nr:thiamine phosphate synthase [Phycisphaerales bacterium]